MPLQIATVGLSTFSITRLNGSVTPVASSVSRCSISGSNFEKRSVTVALQLARRASTSWPTVSISACMFIADQDVELVLDRGDEIQHRQAVPLEVLGEARASVTATPFLLKGSISSSDFGGGLLAVGHARPVSEAACL